MNLLPVADRELRSACRRRGTYRVRGWAVLLALMVYGWTLLEQAQRGVPPAAQGISLFLALSITSFLYCLFIGAWVTADCLSEEKREGTLGLLFLTDLKGRDVVWGKLAATSLNAFYGLLAIVPMLVLPLQLGGIAGALVWRIVVILLNTIFFSLALGLYISTINKDERMAMTATVGTAFLFLALPTIAGFCLAQQFEQGTVAAEFIVPVFSLSAGYAFAACFIRLLGPLPLVISPESIWYSILIYHVLGWAFLLRACQLLPRVWQVDSKRGWLGRLQEAIEQWSYGRAEKRRHYRSLLLDRNPFLWHASRDRLKQGYVWLLLISVSATWIWNHRDRLDLIFNDFTFLAACLILNGFFKIWIASEACLRLMADRRAGALELLLSTPLSTREIIHGQWLALRRQFLFPMVVMLAVELYGLRDSMHSGPLMVGLVTFLLDVAAMGWLSLWMGLWAKNTSHALMITTALVLVLPTLFFTMFAFFLDMALGPRFTFDIQVYVWCGLGLTVDILAGVIWARLQLNHRFRTAALK